MSLSEQTSRVANGGKNTLKAILEKMGATVPDTTKIDGYPALAAGVDNIAISAATKALYGLGSDAVPDDVLNKLSKSILYYSTATPKYQDVKGNPITIGTQIATGSYVGTEASHTISLTFDFPIKFFFISALNYVSVSSSTRNFSSGYYLTESKNMTVLENDRSVGYLPVTLSDDQRTISWTGSASYSSLASTFNALTTYYYKAIG